MGSGRWSTDTYDARAATRRLAGKAAFDYTDTLRRTLPRDRWAPHPSLDPKGVRTRESRDSREHPTSTAIAVIFDVTGSMGHIPVTLQQKLPQLLGVLLGKGYVEHPQILFGAVGDATCDRVPLQIGQFESDNRLDANLENIVIEGGGGGHDTESYELALYFMARHTSLDCVEKRGRKGYLFLIGDERSYARVSRRQVAHIIGDTLQEDIPVEQIVAELTRRYEVFYILPSGAAHGGERTILDYWRALLGQHVLELDDPDAVCETIALAIGLCEDAIALADGANDLEEMGASADAIVAATTALTGLATTAGTHRVPAGDALPGLDTDGGRGIEPPIIRL